MNKQPKTVKLTPHERKKLKDFRAGFLYDIACYENLGITFKTYYQLVDVGTCGQSTYQKLTDKIFSL